MSLTACVNDQQSILDNGYWVDLSHSYEEATPYWPTAEGFKFDTVFAGMTEGGYYYSAYPFSSAEHGGTHIDAPIHFSEGRKTVDELLIDQLTGNAIVVDVTDKVNDYISDYQSGFRQYRSTMDVVWSHRWNVPYFPKQR